MPPNIYGIGDTFDLQKSHVMSALIRKFHEGKIKNQNEVIVWGSGKAKREFLFVEDVADAMVYFMNKYDSKDIDPFINIGAGSDISIKELAILIKEVVGYKGNIRFDTSKPDGMMKKLLDNNNSKKLDWNAKVDSFNVKRFVEEIVRTKAGYVVLTLGQNSGYYCSPNAMYEKYAGYKLGQREAFFNQMVKPLADLMGEAYPELVKRQNQIETLLLEEEERFSRTLDAGMGFRGWPAAKSRCRESSDCPQQRRQFAHSARRVRG